MEKGKLLFLSEYSSCVESIEEIESEFHEAYQNDDKDEMEAIIADNFGEVYKILESYIW